jgi:hypothetical protein
MTLHNPMPMPVGAALEANDNVRKGVVYHASVAQGSAEWHELRRGKLTAGEMCLLVTPATMKAASNDKQRAHLYTLVSQRIAGYVEDTYSGYDMMRGHEDEIDARIAYGQNYAPVEECGFITNDRWGFTIGYSPDGLVGADGLIECKSRKHKFQVETILKSVAEDTAPAEFMIQCQTGLLVSERKWLDFISYSAGLPMATIRVHPDATIQEAIVSIATDAEIKINQMHAEFQRVCKSGVRLIPTERRYEQEITL